MHPLQNTWKSFKCLESELNCGILLTCGQSFRWKAHTKLPNTWVNVLNNKVWYLQQDESHIRYCTHTDHTEDTMYTTKSGTTIDNTDEESFLKDYFQFDVDVLDLYRQWSKKDQNFSKLKTNFSGIRMLRQDPVENLFSFICSQNNNIKRISQLVDKLCRRD